MALGKDGAEKYFTIRKATNFEIRLGGLLPVCSLSNSKRKISSFF